MVTEEQKLVIGLGAVAYQGDLEKGPAERAVSVDRRPLVIQARRSSNAPCLPLINSEGHGGHASLCPAVESDGSRVEQWADASPVSAEMPPHLLLPQEQSLVSNSG
jgi:hypothetical protein